MPQSGLVGKACGMPWRKSRPPGRQLKLRRWSARGWQLSRTGRKGTGTPEQAARMVNSAGAKCILPVHFKTFPFGREATTENKNAGPDPKSL